MRILWNTWRREFEALPALAEEWTEGLAEEFMQNLQGLVAEKRAQRDSALKLAEEVKYVHILHEDLLVFFGLEQAFLRWSIKNCPEECVDEARVVLAQWREILEKWDGKFPPSEGECRSHAATQTFAREAQRAADMIRAGFRAADAYLSSPTPEEGEDEATDTLLEVVAA